MKYLKIVAKGWANYTGMLGQIEFKDGTSIDPVPLVMKARVAAVVRCVEIDSDGNEAEAGPSADLLRMGTVRFEEPSKTVKVTEAEVENEAFERLKKAHRDKIKLHDIDELTEIADRDGIKGLRAIGDKWGVRDRSIPRLIEQILTAQKAFKEENPDLFAKVKENDGLAKSASMEQIDGLTTVQPGPRSAGNASALDAIAAARAEVSASQAAAATALTALAVAQAAVPAIKDVSEQALGEQLVDIGKVAEAMAVNRAEAVTDEDGALVPEVFTEENDPANGVKVLEPDEEIDSDVVVTG